MALRGFFGAYRLVLKHDFNPEGTGFVWIYQMPPIFDFSSWAEAKKIRAKNAARNFIAENLN